jgi:isopenicillin-N epimerase
LDKDVSFLNHGSFGACPKAVLDKQSSLRERLEREPVLFLARELEGLLDSARTALAEFLGADAGGLAFVPNATTGINTVLRSLGFGPGDEILTTNHTYPSCRNAVRCVAGDTGAVAVEAEIPFPIKSPGEVVEGVLRHTSSKTRLCLIDHVTSPTGLVFPVQRIVSELQGKGIDVLVDGAHAPGMLPLDIESLGAAYYTGNCHKWLCAPKGSGFLHVRRDRLGGIRPLAVSLGYNSDRTDRSAFHRQFDWIGTGDPTPYLCVPDAIDFMGSILIGGWPALRAYNREMLLAARAKLCALLGMFCPCPDAMIGSLASMPLPAGESTAYTAMGDNDPVHRELYEEYRIEVPVIAWPSPPSRLLRLSAQIYNKPGDYDRLADALNKMFFERS